MMSAEAIKEKVILISWILFLGYNILTKKDAVKVARLCFIRQNGSKDMLD